MKSYTEIREKKIKPSKEKNGRKKPKVKTQVSTITNALRKIWLWSPERRAAIKRAGGVNCACEECGNKQKDGHKMEVHHNDPCDLTKEAKRIHARLFPPVENLTVLCKECHNEKHP